MAAAQIERDKATTALKDQKGALETERKRVRDAELLGRDWEHARKVASTAEKNVKELEQRIERRKKKRKRFDVISPEATRSDKAGETARRWSELEKAHKQLGGARRDLAALQGDGGDVVAARRLADDLRQRRDHASEQLARANTKANALEARLNALTASERAGDTAERESTLRALQRDERDLEKQIAIRESELEHDRSHVEEVADAGADTPCPVCRRPYGTDYDSILAGYKQRIAKAAASLPKLREDLERTAGRREKAEEARDRAREADRDLRKTSGPSKPVTAEKHLAREHRRVAELDAELKDVKGKLPTAERELKSAEALSQQWTEKEAVVQEREARCREALGALGVTGYVSREHQRASAEAERLAAVAQEARKLEAEVDAESDLDDEIERQRSAAAEARGEEKKARNELDKISLDAKLLGKLERACEKTEQEREEATLRLQQAKLDAKDRSDEVKNFRVRVKEASEIQAEIRRRRVEHRQHTVAADLLNKYRDHEAHRAWPHLEQGASSILAAATEGRYADIRLSDDYKIHIVDRGVEHGLSRFSGGEQDLANLCLRIAIAQWVARERGVQLGFLILDEVFGSQDDERRPRLLSELRELATGRFRQVLVITHNLEIASHCDARIDVSLTEPGRSIATVTA